MTLHAALLEIQRVGVALRAEAEHGEVLPLSTSRSASLSV